MWTRDASHVASAALGAYAFSEIAARVVGDAVAPDTARWLTLVALAVVASAFALVARADARRARADSAEAERRARRDARFRAAVLERATRRDPSRDPEDATRVDCLAALARVVDAGFSLGDGGARAPDPSPGSPPLLATPARREAARAFAAKASEARRIPKDDGPRKDAAGDGFARRVAPPASFTAEDVADGAVVLSRALAGRDDPIEVAVSTDTSHASRVLVSGTREALMGFEVASTTTRSSSTTTTTSAPPSFAAGGCSLDPRDGADRVARVAAMLIDLARAQASRVLREGEPRRVANEGRPCVVRLRLETGREKRRVLGVLGDAAGRGRFRRDGGNGNEGARRTRVIRDSRDERVTRDATWFDVRLVASLVAPRDARRVPREEQKRAASREKNKNEPRTETTELDSEEERAFSFRGNGGDVGDVDALDASLTRAALAATASALGGSFKREPATGPDAVGDGFACAFPLLAHSALPFGEDDDDDADAESFRLDPKLPELSFPASLERSLRDTPGNSTSREKSVRNPRTTRLEAVFHPSVSSGRRAHFRRILETYPGARVTTAKTAEAAEAAAAAALRAGSFALVVCASPTGLETTAAARAAVAAVAARETLVAAAAAADVRGEDAGRRGAALLLAAFGGDLDAACDAAREASADAGAGDDDESRDGSDSQTRRASPASRLAATPESPGEDETRDETARAPFCSSFEFVAAASPATSEEIHAALCAALRRGAEAAAAAAAADAAARRERAAAVSARRASSAAPGGGVRSRRLSDRSDDGEFAEIRGNRSRAPSARASLETPHAGDGSPVYGHFAEKSENELQETPRAADASERSAANDAVVDAVLAAAADTASPPSLPEEGSDGGAEPGLPGSPPRVSGEAPGESLEGMRVLVVDDNHFQLRIVKASLKRSGVELDAAVHGREAVELFEKRLKAIRDVGFDDAENRLATKPPYDVILMDSMMPVMDGCAATIEIRAAERAFRATLPAALLKPGGTFERETMIIGLSAEAGPEYEAGAREAGMDGALGKPCRPEALRDALRRVNQGTFNSWKASSKRGTLHF